MLGRIAPLLLGGLIGCIPQTPSARTPRLSKDACAVGYDSLPRTLSVNSPVKVGAISIFRFTVTNPCATVVPLRQSGNWPFYSVVTDPNGKEVWAPFRVSEFLDATILDMNPGEIKCFERDVPMYTTQGELIEAGEYTVRAAFLSANLYSPAALVAKLIVEPSTDGVTAPRVFQPARHWRYCDKKK